MDKFLVASVRERDTLLCTTISGNPHINDTRTPVYYCCCFKEHNQSKSDF